MDENLTATRIEDVCDQLRQAGHRITAQRLAIMKFVFGTTEHPTVKDIHEALSARFPTMSLMTVYQTVRLLTALGEIDIASTQSEHTHYDGTGLEPHPHLVCQRCGAVVDADPRSMPVEHRYPQTPEPSDLAQGWKIHHWRVEGIGLCPDCQRVTAES